MNDLLPFVFQPALSNDVAHILVDLFVVICGGLAVFLVQRAITQHDEWRAKIEARISALESAKGSGTTESHRP